MTPTLGFAHLGVPTPLVAALAAQGLTDPFPIQSATLPDTLAGRDVLGRGRTGSGKTLAFALPLVARLTGRRTRPSSPRGLVLVPTRELANQVSAVVAPLAAAAGLTTTTIFGGVGQHPQAAALRRGADIVVACPGRLEDLLQQGLCDLGQVEVTVLDEADHMADLGFLPGVKRILDRTPRDGQRMLFSATLDNGVDVLVRRYLSNPLSHAVDPPAVHVSTMTQTVLHVSAADKPAVVDALAAGQGRRLLFTRTKHGAKKLAKSLTMAGIPSVELHGNLGQGARERNLAAFTDGSARVLVATDIAARGIHVDEIELVVHVDPPTESKAFLHRSGRTARAGAGGTVVTLALPDERRDVTTMLRQAKVTATVAAVGPGDELLASLSGPAAERVTPPPAPSAPVVAARGAGGGGRGPRAGSRSGGGYAGGARSSGGRSTSARTGGRPGTGSTPTRGGRPAGGATARPAHGSATASATAWSTSTGGTSGAPAGSAGAYGSAGDSRPAARRRTGGRSGSRPAGPAV